MQRIGRQLFAAAVGVLSLAAAASAQSPDSAYPARPAKSYVMVYPGQTVARAAMPASDPQVRPIAAAEPAAVPVATAPAAAGCSTCGGAAEGCSSCGSSQGSQGWSSLKSRLSLSQPGCLNPVGCGNWKTERTFIFGGCCQFFNCGKDCGSCGAGCGKGGYWSKCPGMIYGPGIGTGMNPCVYDSYLNH